MRAGFSELRAVSPNFSIGTFKVPKIGSSKFFRDISGENIDDIIKRYIKFKSKKNKIYTLYTKEEE